MIIALTGHKRVGKDTVAEYLVKQYGFQRYGFADPMREMLQIAFYWPKMALYEADKDKVDPDYGISPRKALQTLGTEWAQFELSKHEQFAQTTGRMLWVRRFTRHIYDPLWNWVISDLRFPHELEGLWELPGEAVYLVGVYRPDTDSGDTHASETDQGQMRPDYGVLNDGTIDDLHDRVDAIMADIDGRNTHRVIVQLGT